jgi:hypothetical protein
LFELDLFNAPAIQLRGGLYPDHALVLRRNKASEQEIDGRKTQIQPHRNR